MATPADAPAHAADPPARAGGDADPGDWLIASFTLLVIVLLSFGATIQIGYGTDDLSLMWVFSSDESIAVEKLQANVENHDLSPRHFYNYGAVYRTSAFAVVELLSRFGYQTGEVRFLAGALRAVSLFSYLALLFLFHEGLRRFQVSLGIRSAFTLLLAAIPSIYYWAQHIHPDLLQALLIFASLFVLIDAISTPRLLCAGFLAGLAFGTKYSGIFLLPLLFLVAFLQRLPGMTAQDWKEEAGSLARIGAGILGCFLTAWLASNPYVIGYFSAFVRDFLFEARHVAHGHGSEAPRNPLLWFDHVCYELSSIGSWLTFAGILLAVGIPLIDAGRIESGRWARAQRLFQDRRNILIAAVLAYSVIAFGFLLLRVNYRTPRFLMHLLPFWAFMAAIGFSLLQSRMRATRIARVIPLLLVLPPSFLAARSLELLSAESAKYQSEIVAAGNWLRENYAGDTRVLADVYSYLPSGHFTAATVVWGIYPETVDAHDPDVLFLNHNLSRDLSWKKPGSRFTDLDFELGPWDRAPEAQAFHRKLFSPGSGWTVVFENERAVILARER